MPRGCDAARLEVARPAQTCDSDTDSRSYRGRKLIMSAPKLESVKTRLENVIALARLLERIERGTTAPDPAQYRALVRQLGSALEADLPAPALEAILNASPATAELYENLHYAQSGLSRSPLDRAIAAEMQATQALHRLARDPGSAR